jgi:hypothetical protein
MDVFSQALVLFQYLGESVGILPHCLDVSQSRPPSPVTSQSSQARVSPAVGCPDPARESGQLLRRAGLQGLPLQ